MNALPYRPEIDGLRAVAVIAILLFHLDIVALRGGFVGVDVFFVISGYLITRIVRRDVENGHFGFARFYGRRIRRLFPALLATVALTLIAGFSMMTPASYARMASSGLFAIFSLANLKFWIGSGYFDEAAGLKPLLHTWSLSVEEQFYLLWPALIWLAARRAGGRLLPVSIACLGSLSLAWAETTLAIDPSMAFFFMPSRICEFALGALLAWVPASDDAPDALREACLGLGLSAILWSVSRFDRETAFPGFSALVPCGGTALAIWAGNTTYLGALLRNRISLWIGEISYSLYLVHWPLVVFYKQRQFDALDTFDRLLLLALSFGGAVLLHRYVEQRFRHPRDRRAAVPARGFAFGAVAVTVAVSLFAYRVERTGGLPWRYPEAYGRLLEQGDRVTKQDVDTWGLGGCYLGGTYGKEHQFENYDKSRCLELDRKRKNVLVLGDSTAAHLMHGLNEVHGKQIRFLQATIASCRGAAEVEKEGSNCNQLHRYVLDAWLPTHARALDAVVVGTRWEDPELLPWAERLIAQIQSAGAKVVILGPPVTFKTAAATVIGARYGPVVVNLQFAMGDRELPGLRVPPEGIAEYVRQMEGLLRPVVERRKAGYISLVEKQCDETGCAVATPGPDGNPRFIQRDKLHLTPDGSVWVASTMTVAELTGAAATQGASGFDEARRAGGFGATRRGGGFGETRAPRDSTAPIRQHEKRAFGYAGQRDGGPHHGPTQPR